MAKKKASKKKASKKKRTLVTCTHTFRSKKSDRQYRPGNVIADPQDAKDAISDGCARRRAID